MRLFATFMKIGAFTFGGGWAMISLIEREVVDKNRWIERDEFLDLLAISQSLPGILAVNISVSVGDKLRGFKGSLAAALGTILPSFLIILLIAIFLTPDIIKENRVVASIFMGIRPCVVALIIAPVITSARARQNHVAHGVDSGGDRYINICGMESHSVHSRRRCRRLSVVPPHPQGT